MHLCVNYLEDGVRRLFETSCEFSKSRAPGVADVFEDSATISMDALCVLLNRYCDEIELFNPAYGLVSVKDRNELILKHILDSLAPLKLIKELINGSSCPRIVDAGSGAGLPGIPLALALPDVSFTLVEQTGRRAGFLRNTAAVLPLPNVEVLETRVEEAPSLTADIVCFRAFRPLEPKILKALFRLLKPGSCLAAYKGRRKAVLAEIEPLLDILKQQNAEWRVIPCFVPFLDDERNLLLIRKP